MGKIYGGKTIQGVNDIATSAPWMVKFLKNKEDAFIYAKTSSKKIMTKCPDCGYERENSPNNIYYSGFSCPICSDKISRPNKFARNVLLQISQLENLQFEYTSSWTKHKRFDNYFEYQNNKYVLEMDGDQHRIDTQWGTALEQKLNDEVKDYLARSNNVKIIRIIAPFRQYDVWINEFLNSEIGDLVKSANIDWNKCIEKSEHSFIKELCDYYNNHNEPSTDDIAKVFKTNRHSVSKYLQLGAKIGWCNYTIEKVQQRKMLKLRTLRLQDSNKVRVEDLNHNIIGVFDRLEICQNEMSKLYPNIKFSMTGIMHSCTRYDNPYNGFYFFYEGVDIIQKYYLDKDIFYEICKCYQEHNNNIFINELKKILNIRTDRNMIASYLKVGTMFGLCNYSPNNTLQRKMDKLHKVTKEKHKLGVNIDAYDNGKLIGKFQTMRECIYELNNIYTDICINEKSFRKASYKAKNGYFTYKGLDFKIYRKEK